MNIGLRTIRYSYRIVTRYGVISIIYKALGANSIRGEHIKGSPLIISIPPSPGFSILFIATHIDAFCSIVTVHNNDDAFIFKFSLVEVNAVCRHEMCHIAFTDHFITFCAISRFFE